ncbi:MAG: hypothetical protein H3C43_13170, partial [Leptonema sp. (in: Bacteria)]|nr:hypothetical protein [Leptonema sp. (in: bacteria)]
MCRNSQLKAALSWYRSFYIGVIILIPSLVSANSSPGLFPVSGTLQSTVLWLFFGISIIIVGIYLWIAKTSKNPTDLDIKQAYKLRSILIVSACVIAIGLLAATLPHNPYTNKGEEPDRVVYVASEQFSFLYSFDPIQTKEDKPKVENSRSLEIDNNSLVEFRVTSLDVTHNFAVYDDTETLIGQTQAMPGYVNRLRIKFTKPGKYSVLCLEFCGTGHHVMRSSLTVKEGNA